MDSMIMNRSLQPFAAAQPTRRASLSVEAVPASLVEHAVVMGGFPCGDATWAYDDGHVGTTDKHPVGSAYWSPPI